MERVITIMQNPRQYKIPDWFLNRQKDVTDGKYSQVCVEMGELREKQGVRLGLALGDQGIEQSSLNCLPSVQVLANGLDNKLREDLERLKKIRAHRGLRHFWG